MRVKTISDTTQILKLLVAGDPSAEEKLYPHVYDELRRLAVRLFRGQPAGHTLQPTALVHEAYLNLIDPQQIGFEDRTHFFAVAAKVMRRILIDHARRRAAARRGGQWTRVAWDDEVIMTTDKGIDILALNEALEKLTKRNPRQARVVELRFFGGLTIAEAAEVLGVGHATVEADWAFAKAWLAKELGNA